MSASQSPLSVASLVELSPELHAYAGRMSIRYGCTADADDAAQSAILAALVQIQAGEQVYAGQVFLRCKGLLIDRAEYATAEGLSAEQSASIVDTIGDTDWADAELLAKVRGIIDAIQGVTGDDGASRVRRHRLVQQARQIVHAA